MTKMIENEKNWEDFREILDLMRRQVPKSLLQVKDFEELINNPKYVNSKLLSIKFIKNNSMDSSMGLKAATIYYDLWVKPEYGEEHECNFK